ncbi:N-acetylmuramoyl-L-alanine amidase [Cetobacterium sp. 2A]|nr:N-acetylmuramoyl-L-alanine amidase [Cetobacterium sp. 2A]
MIFLAGCNQSEKKSNEETFKIDRSSYFAKGQNNRIRHIILHYTVLNDEKSIKVLTERDVSAHYLVTSNDDQPILSLVPDEKRAWHAGISSFDNRTNLNDTSIGIEIVNLGIKTQDKFGYKFPQAQNYFPYTDVQIEKIGFLLKDLSNKYSINPKYILGHSDIAPGRKPDPGPLFPWKKLYSDYGVGAWYDDQDYQDFLDDDFRLKYNTIQIKKQFIKYGYPMNLTDKWDNESKQIIQAFQNHFRPEKITGVVDAQTFAIIKALNFKYKD